MKEHEHDDERRQRASVRAVWLRVLRRMLFNGDKSLLAQLDQLRQDERERREHERQARSETVAAAAEEMLRALNRGEHVDPAADPAPESAAPGRYHDVSDHELDLCSVDGIAEAKKRGLLPPHFYQPRGDYEARVAAMKADHWLALTGGERTPSARRAGFARRVPVRPRRRREHRPGHRKTTSASRAGPGGDPDPDEPDPPYAAGSLDDDWLACAGLSAADAQRAADRVAAACSGSLTPVGLRWDVGTIWPDLRGDGLTAAVVAVYMRLPRVLRDLHDRAAYAGREAQR